MFRNADAEVVTVLVHKRRVAGEKAQGRGPSVIIIVITVVVHVVIHSFA